MDKLKILLPFLAKYKKIIYWGLFFVTLSNISSTVLPQVVGAAVDLIKSQNFIVSDIYKYIAIILALTFSSGFFMYWTRRTIIVVSREIERDLREAFLNGVLDKTQDFFGINSTGSLMALATNDINAARDFFGPAVMYAANTISAFVFSLWFMLHIDITMTILVIAPLPLLAYVVYLIGKKIHVAFKTAQEHYSLLTAQAQESFSGSRVVKTYSRADSEIADFKELSREYVKKNLKLAKYQALMFPALMAVVASSQILILYVGGSRVISGALSLGELTQFFIYLNLLIWPIAAIGWITNVVQRASASAARLSEKVFDDAANEDEIDLPFNPQNFDIELNELNYSIQNIEILKGVNLSIPFPATIGISGGVGSGKSVLANVLAGLYLNYSGSAKLGGKELKEIGAANARRISSLVRQEAFLFSMTIAENLRFAKPDASDEELINICKKVKLHEEILTFPDAYDTMLGERGITLSGGQKQRLSIAMTLLKDSPIVIMDDSLSAVDADTEKHILSELKNSVKDKTLIIIAHRISAIKEADRIIILEDGKVKESGDHNELVELGGTYSELVIAQELEAEISHID
jgi:ATP-binding cassette subfamily B protein